MASNIEVAIAAVAILVGAVLLALTFGFLDSGGVEIKDENNLMWDDYRPINGAGILGASGAIEIVDVAGSSYIHAKETGYGKVVYSNGKEIDYRVTRAVFDMIIMNGQSNSAYYYIHDTPPEADKAPAPPIGTSYYYGRLDNPKMNYTIQPIDDYALHDFIDPETGELRLGDKGPGFCSEYVKATGHKALWVGIGIGAKRVAAWLPPDSSCWVYDQEVFDRLNADLKGLPIDIDRTFMLWAQGESDKSAGTTVSTYVSRFMTFWNAASAAWGHDIDTCYLIAGRTAKVGNINTAFNQLAAQNDDIKLAVGANLVDSFTISNGLMVDDNLHYMQEGDNAVANAAVRYVLQDLGFTVPEPAPVYLLQTRLGVTVNDTFTPPDYTTAYMTDGRSMTVGAAFEGTVDTSAAGTTVLHGTAVISESRLLKAVPPATLIVTVIDAFTLDGVKYSVSGTDATVTGYEGTPTVVTVPATVSKEGLTWNVVSIGAAAFQDCPTLTALDLGSVKEVGNSAFYNCTALETVTATEVITIGSNGFRGCAALTAISLPNATTLQAYAFNYCTSLESVNIPAAASLSNYVFRGCTATTSVTLGPLTGTLGDAFGAWTFYDSDGTTVLAKTAANLAGNTFEGTANRLVKVTA